MNIINKLQDANGNAISVDTLKKNNTSDTLRGVSVVYAHTDVVNDNGLKLNADSIQVTRDKYPVLVEHSDNRVEDVVAYITTTGKPNDKGEFVGVIHFYNTEQGKHASRLWDDGVYNELSVSYYIKDYEVIDALDETEYINVKSALLKEVSIVSVGADRDTHELPTNDTNDETETDDVVEEASENATNNETENTEPEVSDVEDDEEPEDVNGDELETLKLSFYKGLLV